MNVCCRSTHSQETIATINRASLGRPERHGRFNPAQGAFDRNLYSLARERLTICLHIRGDSVVLFYLTGLAPLRVILQSLVGEEELLSRSKDKFFIAINTSQYLVLVFVHCGPPTPCSLVGYVLTVLWDRRTSFFALAVSYIRSLLGLSLNDLTTCLFFAHCDHTHFPDFVTKCPTSKSNLSSCQPLSLYLD